MPEQLPPPPVAATIVYRPISGFAIAGLAIASLFALVMMVLAALALIQSTPFFYSPWLLVVPAVALVLSFIARSQIRNSEGTKAGDRLAQVGIWLSLLTGLTYFVYYTVTGMAVTSQANAFVMELGTDSGFFPHLQKAGDSKTDLYAAYLLSVPANMRNVKAEDHKAVMRLHDQSDGPFPGRLTGFLRSNLVRFVASSSAGQVQIEPLGVEKWDYDEKSYLVRRSYRVTTAEGVMEVKLTVRSIEGETAGEARKWFVDLKSSAAEMKSSTPLGLGLGVLWSHSMTFVGRLLVSLNSGESLDFAQYDQTPWQQLLPDESRRTLVQQRFTKLFGSKEPGRLGLQSTGDQELGDREMINGKMRASHVFKWKLEPQNNEPPLMLEGRIIVESKGVLDPGALSSTTDVAWELKGIALTRITAMDLKKGR